jgi:hypothetical protein
MAESARPPPFLTRQSDETQQLGACVAALERQNEELKARVAELEAALERGAGATTEVLKEEGSEAGCQRRVTCQSADSCCRRSRRSRTCNPKEGAAYQGPSGSASEPSDRFDRSR